ncbi:Homeobox-leucine zipper protein HDG12 [Spatholobus suberectus]|nr:Homeobox-leucine zipper protein HDG12 [Spatholobus suberectus]
MRPPIIGGSGRGNQGAYSYRHRHDPVTVARLEEMFRECAHPDENRRRQISEELGLNLQQVKFWFQNKKTQIKTMSERLDNNALRLENERIQSENLIMRETLQNVLCVPCGGRSLGSEERELYLQTLRAENILLTQEAKIQAPNHGINTPSRTPTLDQNIPLLSQDISALHEDNMPPLDLDKNLEAILEMLDKDMLPQPIMSQSTDMEKSLMSQIANTAMEELMKLLSMNEPFWFRSLHDGKFILQSDSYQRIFRRSNCLSGPHARIESSKDSRVVNMGGAQLVEMFLNSDKWVNLFPTIVKKAQTIQVFESGLLANRNGALQLMNAEMHILSHLVPTREFHFLRYCKQIEVGVWAIGDVSLDSSNDKTTVSHAWRLPSGCLIQEMTHGLCRVSWVEHVEVDDKIQTHQLFRDVIIGDNAYGAERWVLTLERMCERLACASANTIPNCDVGGVIKSREGRRSIMHLAHRMVKTFCRTLDMQDNNFPHLTRINNGGVRVSVRMNNREPDVPKGMILSAATSFWLPLSPQTVFDYLIDNKERAKWEALWYGNPGLELQRISTGSNPGNCISILRPISPNGNNTTILQESYVDALGSMIAYAVFDMETMNFALRGEDTSQLLILPSGFTISWDGQSNALEGQSGQVGKSGGSLVTLMFQLLASTPTRMEVDLEFVGSVTSLVSSTVEKIKGALNCSN